MMTYCEMRIISTLGSMLITTILRVKPIIVERLNGPRIRIAKAVLHILVDSGQTAQANTSNKIYFTVKFSKYIENTRMKCSLLIFKPHKNKRALHLMNNPTEFKFCYLYLMVYSTISLQVPKSDEKQVTLSDVQRKSSGQFKCEVTSDGPLFHTDIREAPLFVIGE